MLHFDCPVDQLVDQLPVKEIVTGSSPVWAEFLIPRSTNWVSPSTVNRKSVGPNPTLGAFYPREVKLVAAGCLKKENNFRPVYQQVR